MERISGPPQTGHEYNKPILPSLPHASEAVISEAELLPHEARFKTLYAQYQSAREDLHTAELTGDVASTPNLLEKTRQASEALSDLAFEIYEDSSSIQDFEERIEPMIDASAQEDALRMGTTDTELGAYMHPLSTESSEYPSPVEAIAATARNLAIASEFARVGSQHADGVLMSGTNSWGSFYAVRGGVPDKLQEAGIEQLPHGEFSDVDLLVTANNEQLSQVINDYIEQGMLSETEAERWATFQRLHTEGAADIFSARANYRGIEESLHFVPAAVMDKVSSMDRIHPERGGDVDSVRDFRPNIPGNIRKHGAYLTGELTGQSTVRFEPEITEVRSPRGDQLLGYISENTVGGPAVVDNRPTYYMGVISFYLLAGPTVMVDKEAKLSQQISNLKQLVREQMHGAQVEWLPRQEKMPARVLEAIRRDLS